MISDVAVPAGVTQVVGIAAGPYYCLAVKADGTVVSWGLSDTAGGQLPPGLTNVVSVHASGAVAAALKADGTVVTWAAASKPSRSFPRRDWAGSSASRWVTPCSTR